VLGLLSNGILLSAVDPKSGPGANQDAEHNLDEENNNQGDGIVIKFYFGLNTISGYAALQLIPF